MADANQLLSRTNIRNIVNSNLYPSNISSFPAASDFLVDSNQLYNYKCMDSARSNRGYLLMRAADIQCTRFGVCKDRTTTNAGPDDSDIPYGSGIYSRDIYITQDNISSSASQYTHVTYLSFTYADLSSFTRKPYLTSANGTVKDGTPTGAIISNGGSTYFGQNYVTITQQLYNTNYVKLILNWSNTNRGYEGAPEANNCISKSIYYQITFYNNYGTVSTHNINFIFRGNPYIRVKININVTPNCPATTIYFSRAWIKRYDNYTVYTINSSTSGNALSIYFARTSSSSGTHIERVTSFSSVRLSQVHQTYTNPSTSKGYVEIEAARVNGSTSTSNGQMYPTSGSVKSTINSQGGAAFSVTVSGGNNARIGTFYSSSF